MGRRPTSGVRFIRFHPRHYCWTGDAEDSGIGRFGGTYGSWLAEAARLTGLSGEPGQRLVAGCAREIYGLLSSSRNEETLLWDSFSPAQSL